MIHEDRSMNAKLQKDSLEEMLAYCRDMIERTSDDDRARVERAAADAHDKALRRVRERGAMLRARFLAARVHAEAKSWKVARELAFTAARAVAREPNARAGAEQVRKFFQTRSARRRTYVKTRKKRKAARR
jgi:hypothetical protein